MLGEQKISFLGLDFHTVTEGEALNWILDQSREQSFSYLVTPNVDHVVNLHSASTEEIEEPFSNADLTICDSRVLSILGRLAGISLPVVPGSDLTRELLENCPAGTCLAVVGGTPSLLAKLSNTYPQFKWAAHHPPMGVRQDPVARHVIADFVCHSDARIFLFAFGAPQSEITCAEIKQSGRGAGVALCIGASLEFLAGDKVRAPRWMQLMGLEWLFRLLSEPKRLWRRYLVTGPRILPIWLSWLRLRSTR